MRRTITASQGYPYRIGVWSDGDLACIKRKHDNGNTYCIYFSRADAINVTNELMDMLEQGDA